MDFLTRFDYFRQDLTRLKLPHPSMNNFKIKSDREILMCFWETKRYSPLWVVFNNIIRVQDSNDEIIAAKNTIQIKCIRMYESFSEPLRDSLSRSSSPSSHRELPSHLSLQKTYPSDTSPHVRHRSRSPVSVYLNDLSNRRPSRGRSKNRSPLPLHEFARGRSKGDYDTEEYQYGPSLTYSSRYRSRSRGRTRSRSPPSHGDSYRRRSAQHPFSASYNHNFRSRSPVLPEEKRSRSLDSIASSRESEGTRFHSNETPIRDSREGSSRVHRLPNREIYLPDTISHGSRSHFPSSLSPTWSHPGRQNFDRNGRWQRIRLDNEIPKIESLQTVLLEIEKQSSYNRQTDTPTSHPPWESLYQNTNDDFPRSLPPPHQSLPPKPNFLASVGSAFALEKSGDSSTTPETTKFLDTLYNDLISADSDESARMESNKSATRTPNLQISKLTDEFWDIGRGMSSASKRLMMIEMQLEVELEELMIWGDPEPESDEMYEELVKAEDRLREEQKQSAHMEMVLKDVLRECSRPTIVPALLSTLSL